ncbi:MAG: leucine-rich repeat protein [Alphaproteobacteria bacterium]|nr:leucine-rich repeat protein [Alphaproteobacteria bacterium]
MAKEKSVFDRLKKQNGELFAKTVRNGDNGILDIPNILEIVKFAGKDALPLIPFLRMLKEVAPDVHGVYQDPITLLKKAGYNAFVADTEEKKNSIKHYYALGEAICTFKDAERHQKYYIIHAVKEGAEKLNRRDFKNPEREDAYGTSVISIQILKKGGFISIKNRYNHTVQACDNTFNSNPDNIILGLSESLKRYFNVDFSAGKAPLPNGYTFQRGKIYQYHKEKENIYFGDGFYLTNGKCYEIDKDSQLLTDVFLIDLKEKKIKDLTRSEGKSYQILKEAIDGKKLQVKTIKDTKILFADGKEVLRSRGSKLVGLTLYNETLGKNSFFQVDDLEVLNLPNLKNLEAETFFACPCLKEVNMPLCEEVTALNFRYTAPDFKGNIPTLNQKGIFFAGPFLVDTQKNKLVTVTNIPPFSFKAVFDKEFKNKKMTIESNGNTVKILADGIEKITVKEGVIKSLLVSDKFVWEHNIPNTIESLDIPNVEFLNQTTFGSFHNLKYLNAPKLKHMPFGCFSSSPIEVAHLESLEKMAGLSMQNFCGKEINLPKLTYIGGLCLGSFHVDMNMYAPRLKCVTTFVGSQEKEREFPFKDISPENLKAVLLFCSTKDVFSTDLGKHLFEELKNAQKVTVRQQEFPRSATFFVDGVELCHTFGGNISRVTLRNLKEVPSGMIKDFEHLESVSLPDAEVMGPLNLTGCPNLKRVDMPRLKKVDESDKSFLKKTPALERFYAPKLKNRLSYIKWHPNLRTILRYMDEANAPKQKGKLSFLKAIFYRSRDMKK